MIVTAVERLMIPRELRGVEFGELRYAPYQRELDGLWVRRIVAEFDPRIVRRPWVSLRDGVYWLVDGQHTVSALEALGYESMDCEVLEDLTYEEEARLHDSIQRLRKAPTLYDSFRALIEARDPEVLAMREEAERWGFRFTPNRKARSGRDIAAIGAVWKEWARNSPERMAIAFSAMVVWQPLDRAVPGYVFAGVCRFVETVGEGFDQAHLEDVLEANAPRQIELKVKDFGPQGTSSGSRVLRVRKVVLDLYNKGAKHKVELKATTPTQEDATTQGPVV